MKSWEVKQLDYKQLEKEIDEKVNPASKNKKED